MWREMILNLHPNSVFSEPVLQNVIEDTEEDLEINLPSEIKSLLAESNGITDEYGLGIIWSIERIKQKNLFTRNSPEYAEMYMPLNPLVFFADAGNGDLFGFSVVQNRINSSQVFAWSHENDSRTWVAPSLEKYLEWWLSGKIQL